MKENTRGRVDIKGSISAKQVMKHKYCEVLIPLHMALTHIHMHIAHESGRRFLSLADSNLIRWLCAISRSKGIKDFFLSVCKKVMKTNIMCTFKEELNTGFAKVCKVSGIKPRKNAQCLV